MVLSIFDSFLISFFIFLIMHFLTPFRRVKCCDEGWIDISNRPQHVDYRNRIFLTDGFIVRSCSDLEYNHEGKIILPIEKIVATHWKKWPLPQE